jgi:hypothetical protein
MPAGVHASRKPRRVLERVLLLDRQRVHVGPKADRAGAIAAAEHPDDAGAADALMDLDTDATEFVGDAGGGPMLPEPQFGMGVEIPSQAGQSRKIAADDVDRGHDGSLAGLPFRRRGKPAGFSGLRALLRLRRPVGSLPARSGRAERAGAMLLPS